MPIHIRRPLLLVAVLVTLVFGHVATARAELVVSSFSATQGVTFTGPAAATTITQVAPDAHLNIDDLHAELQADTAVTVVGTETVRFNAAVVPAGPSASLTVQSSDAIVTGPIDLVAAVTLHAATDIRFADDIGDVASPTSLSATAATIDFDREVTTVGAQTYDGAVDIGIVLTLRGGGDITFLGTVDSTVPTPLRTETVGTTRFAEDVGGSGPLNYVVTTGPVEIGGDVTTIGGQSWGPMTLGSLPSGVVHVFDAGSGNVQFSAIDGGTGYRGMDVRTSGRTTFLDDIGAAAPVDDVVTDAAGTTHVGRAGLGVRLVLDVFGNITFRDPLTLRSHVDLLSLADTVTLGSTVNGRFDLAVDAPDVVLGGAIGGVSPLLFLTIDPATLDLAVPIAAVGAVHLDVLRLVADVTLTGDTVIVDGSISGAHALTIDAATSSTLSGAVGTPTALTSLSAVGASVAAPVTTTGRQHWRGSGLTLGSGATSLTSSGGAIDIDGGVILNGAGTRTISPAAASTLSGSVSAGVANTLVKAGSGTLTMSEHVGPNVALRVDAGRLQLEVIAPDGVFEPATMTGGRIAGRGLFFGGLTATGGELDAMVGDPEDGELMIFTSLVLAPATTVRARVGVTGNLYAAGTAGLAGATLSIESGGPLPDVGGTHTVLDVTGGTPAAGTFAGLPEGATTFAAGALWKITYAGGLDGHDVVLTRLARATTTTLTVGSASSEAGTPVALTATASAVIGASPTGTVTFLDGASILGTAPLTNGTATLLTTTLPVGDRTLMARFEASSDLAASTSAPVSHTVNPAPVTPKPPVGPTPPPVEPKPPVPATPPPVPTPTPVLVTKIYANGACVRASRTNLRVSYTLARAARVTYTLQRRLRPPSARLTACPTRVTIGTGQGRLMHAKLRSLTRSERAGRRTVTLRQLVGARTVSPGVHRMVIEVRDARGRTLQTVTRSFIVLAS